MFLLFAEKAAEASEQAPAIVQFVNHYVGEPVFNFEMKYTYPFWQKFFGYFGTTPEKVFGEYTPENAVPWYTVMFIIAVALTFVVVWVLKPRRLSVEEPTYTQLVLEKGMLAIRDLLADNVGPHGVRYFPVVATFGILILISNLMGLIPGLMAPTSATSVTFALGITSFVYYNAIGIRENGLLGHLGHFAGPILWLAPLLFVVELISNFVRPISLGVRLFGNMFSDEQVMTQISNLYSPYTNFLLPVALMGLSVFVAFMQTFIFVLLSIIYISEVSHAPHAEEHHGGAQHPNLEEEGGVFTLPEHA
ncbi:MAG: ATP synthase F0 subunit A [Acidobacteria bacterium]|nr:MAG: ATP synthase F0 subunit A [Acidobacteriota bacterium]